MNITPMDLQVLIPKSTEVGKNQQISDQQLTNNQGFVSEDFKKITEHKQKQVEDLKIIHSASEVSKYVTISLGLLHVDFSEVDINEDGFYTMADDALYLAKKRGRNRVAIHESDDLELF